VLTFTRLRKTKPSCQFFSNQAILQYIIQVKKAKEILAQVTVCLMIYLSAEYQPGPAGSIFFMIKHSAWSKKDSD